MYRENPRRGIARRLAEKPLSKRQQLSSPRELLRAVTLPPPTSRVHMDPVRSRAAQELFWAIDSEGHMASQAKQHRLQYLLGQTSLHLEAMEAMAGPVELSDDENNGFAFRVSGLYSPVRLMGQGKVDHLLSRRGSVVVYPHEKWSVVNPESTLVHELTHRVQSMSAVLLKTGCLNKMRHPLQEGHAEGVAARFAKDGHQSWKADNVSYVETYKRSEIQLWDALFWVSYTSAYCGYLYLPAECSDPASMFKAALSRPDVVDMMDYMVPRHLKYIANRKDVK